MKNLFSNIRKNLLKKGNVRRYLAYAFGEILLIMIGILLALQLNNLNQARADRDKAQGYLQALHQDLEYSKTSLARVIKKSARVQEHAFAIVQLSKLNPDPIEVPTFDSLISGTVGYTIFMPSEGTINELIYSGELSLIEDARIRSSIASWEADLRFIREVESDGKKTLTDYYLDYLYDHVDTHEAWERLDPIHETKNSEVLKDMRFRNIVTEIGQNMRWLNNLYQEKDEQIDSLMALIQEELDD